MVYKIRNKAFFLTQSGWKNNYHAKVLNDVTDVNSSQTYIIRTHVDAPPLIRYYAQYRNISRKVKQFLYGDRAAENLATLWIKAKFRHALDADTPIELVQPGPDQRLINQGDREYELIGLNTHPAQLETYRAANDRLRQEREDQALRDQGQEPLMDQFFAAAGRRMRDAKEAKGDELTSDELHAIFEDCYTQLKIAQGAEAARKPNGDFNDFLEVRRPYVEPGVANAQVKAD